MNKSPLPAFHHNLSVNWSVEDGGHKPGCLGLLGLVSDPNYSGNAVFVQVQIPLLKPLQLSAWRAPGLGKSAQHHSHTSGEFQLI